MEIDLKPLEERILMNYSITLFYILNSNQDSTECLHYL